MFARTLLTAVCAAAFGFGLALAPAASAQQGCQSHPLCTTFCLEGRDECLRQGGGSQCHTEYFECVRICRQCPPAG
ncbi:hypothetical protein [Lysobacter enzymogenes]|uniref:hypothetical protein n=1 Tax=Lysobacter enzymogenes TaxID=69 RepID=UPI001A96ED0A|nr:hypothetical protein [Lysobacter enzymogenes]QQP95456.1 hypothetical protein JHW38_19775 [Lysobacter enzymogenes]